ncbi:MAG: four helix bundle protein, partial [Planctomycetota bacterium]|nr:four helix bundle protein [Planctomycetota bacterium]
AVVCHPDHGPARGGVARVESRGSGDQGIRTSGDQGIKGSGDEGTRGSEYLGETVVGCGMKPAGVRRYRKSRQSRGPVFKIAEEKNIYAGTDKTPAEQRVPIAGFEKLWVWQKAHALMLAVHQFCRGLTREETRRDRDQIERSSASVCDNIAEGHGAYYYNDKIKGFCIARKEAGETQNHVRTLCGKSFLNLKRADEWVLAYEEVIRGINGFIRYVRDKKSRKP